MAAAARVKLVGLEADDGELRAAGEALLRVPCVIDQAHRWAASGGVEAGEAQQRGAAAWCGAWRGGDRSRGCGRHRRCRRCGGCDAAVKRRRHAAHPTITFRSAVALSHTNRNTRHVTHAHAHRPLHSTLMGLSKDVTSLLGQYRAAAREVSSEVATAQRHIDTIRK